jgi:hypothetical protein
MRLLDRKSLCPADGKIGKETAENAGEAQVSMQTQSIYRTHSKLDKLSSRESNRPRKVGACSITGFGLQSSANLKFPCLVWGLGNIDAETYAPGRPIIDQKMHEFQGYVP